ncbi:MAG: flexitail domain-containing putative surface protein, partial [Dehalococcoidia bacterium]|nr:flexitail domain-containing putative surface protein [Dehalococcoidia bacterium]
TFGCPATNQIDEGATRRALLIGGYNSLGTPNDIKELKLALAAGGWKKENIHRVHLLNEAGFSKCVSDWFANADDDDVSLLLYTGHGGTRPDQNGDEPDGVDEVFSFAGRRGNNSNFVRDDTVRDAMLGMPGKGPKILVADSCQSHGMLDGAADPGQKGGEVNTNRIVLTASSLGEPTMAGGGLGHSHHRFTGFLIAGLSGAASGDAPRADFDPVDGVVTVHELFSYAAFFTGIPPGTAHTPLIADPWGLDQTPLTTYNQAAPKAYVHKGDPIFSPEREQCDDYLCCSQDYEMTAEVSIILVEADVCQGGYPPGMPPIGCDSPAVDGDIASGSYLNCVADIQHNQTTNALAAATFCYFDNPVTTVNFDDSGGDVACAPFGTGSASECGDGLPGAPPPSTDTLADVDDPHTQLLGEFNKTTNEVSLEGCFQNVENPARGPNLYVDMLMDADTLQGTSDIWLNRADCSDPAATPPSVEDAEIVVTEAQPKDGLDPASDWDTDFDGCSDKQELQSGLGSEADGGLRDPFNRWDLYDVNHDGTVDLFIDIFGVAGAFGTPGDDNTNRGSPLIGSAGAWNIRGPDATVDLFNDIFGVAAQFGHNCN